MKQLFRRNAYTAGGSCLVVTAQSHEKRQAAPDEDNHAAFTAFDERHVVLASRLPNRYADLWAWLFLQDEKTLLDVLAFCVAFRDNLFSDPAGLVRYVSEQRSFAKVRPDMKIVFVREFDTLQERLDGTREILRALAAIAEKKKR